MLQKFYIKTRKRNSCDVQPICKKQNYQLYKYNEDEKYLPRIMRFELCFVQNDMFIYIQILCFVRAKS